MEMSRIKFEKAATDRHTLMRRQHGRKRQSTSMRLLSPVLMIASVPVAHAWSASPLVFDKTVTLPLDLKGSIVCSKERQPSSHTTMSLDLQMQQHNCPTMFLNQRFYPAATLAASPPIDKRVIESYRREHGTMQKRAQEPGATERRVLGFDIFSLDARRSNVDLEVWKSGDTSSVSGNDMPFFAAPGLAWNSKNNIPTMTSAKSLSLIHSTLPAWFPWIPTKSQIDSLKVSELKEACVQRGLIKNGNKATLRERLFQWTTEKQYQAKITGEFLSDWFEDAADVGTPSNVLTSTEATNNARSPNSLAEWARTVDLEPLLQKRKAIHIKKRQGQACLKKPAKQQRASKEYLLQLSKALQTPTSPYSSNVKVKELYTASREADQLGERQVSIGLLETLLRVTPKDGRIYRRLARMYSEQGDLDQARATLQLGLRRLPDSPWLWHGLGQLELKYGCAEYQARKNFLKAIAVDPSFAHAYHAMGIFEHSQGNIAKAMKILKQGVDYCPTNHRLHHALGDLYRGAKLHVDAERSYRRALEHGPSVSRCFAYSALARVVYEQDKIEEARGWLRKSLTVNGGRHAQGWVSLAQLEESEGNIERARFLCVAAITQYEKGLIEMRQRFRKKRQMERGSKELPSKDLSTLVDPVNLKNLLLRAVPRYRSGDKFLEVYRNWARVEERYGSFETVDQVYKRARVAFPLDYSLALDWARYHAKTLNHDRARTLFAEACSIAASRHSDPYRLYGEFEMSLGNYDQARKIMFRGAQAVSQSPDGALANRRGLAELFHAWALTEWHLNNLPRAEVLFDHALRLTEAGAGGSRLRSLILFSIARLEHYRGELHLAQHCLGLCLKENQMPGGNAPVWELWAAIARAMENPLLEEECKHQTELARQQGVDSNGVALGAIATLSGISNKEMQHWMRREPWQDSLFGTSVGSLSRIQLNLKYPKSGSKMKSGHGGDAEL